MRNETRQPASQSRGPTTNPGKASLAGTWWSRMQPRFCCLLLAATVSLHASLASATAWLHRHVHGWRTVFPWSRASVSAVAKPKKNLDTAETRGNTPPGSSLGTPLQLLYCAVCTRARATSVCCCCADQGEPGRATFTRRGAVPLGEDWNDQAGPGTPERRARERRVEGSPRGSESGGGDAAKDSMGRGPRTVQLQHRQRDKREKRTVR